MKLLANIANTSFNKYAEDSATPVLSYLADSLSPLVEKGKEYYQGAKGFYQAHIQPILTPALEELVRAHAEYGDPGVVDGIASLGGRLFTAKESLKKNVSESTTGTFQNIIPAFKIMQQIFEISRSLQNDMNTYGMSEKVHKQYLDQLTSKITEAKNILSNDYNINPMTLRPADQATHQLLQKSFEQLDAMQALVKKDYGKKIGAKMIVLTDEAKKELKDMIEYYKKLSKDQAYVDSHRDHKKGLQDNITSLENLYNYYESKNTLRAGDMNRFTKDVTNHLAAKKTWTDSYESFVNKQKTDQPAVQPPPAAPVTTESGDSDGVGGAGGSAGAGGGGFGGAGTQPEEEPSGSDL
jgi:hypothetical protein